MKLVELVKMIELVKLIELTGQAGIKESYRLMQEIKTYTKLMLDEGE